MQVSDLLSENNSLTAEEQNEVISDAVKNLTEITEKQETSSYIADVASIVNTVTDIVTVLTLNLGDENITNPTLEIVSNVLCMLLEYININYYRVCWLCTIIFQMSPMKTLGVVLER